VEACRFEIPPCDQADVARLRHELGVSATLGQVLVRRGLADPGLAGAFLAADERHPTSAFSGIARAVGSILARVHAGELITVHGDYDVDGICSTAILVRAVRALGGSVDHYLPDRATDGYGLSETTVKRLAARGTRLLVTADCGVTAVEEVALARSLGVDVVVSDHHTPRSDGRLPQAPVVHPRLCGYPCPDLCAAGVAYKLAEALLDAARAGAAVDPLRLERLETVLREDLDLVALASIADLVPLAGENRALVRRGLTSLAATSKPGLRALMAVARVDPSRVDERAVAFALAPRLNASGRMYRADAALELVLTADRLRAAQIAEELDSANRERRAVELAIRREAEARMRELGERPAYVLAGDGWHPGVIGIVASRLVERSRRPVVLIGLDGQTGRGSGRSVEGFDLLAGLDACAQHLLRHGGHRAAGGLQIERGQVDAFACALAAHAASVIDPADLVPVERVDAVVDCGELGLGLAEELRSVAPFGRGNPTISLMVSGARVADARPMGEGRHVRFTVQSQGGRARAVAFGVGSRLPVAEGEPVQATFTLEVNEWNGVIEPRLVLRELAPAEEAGEPEPIAEPERELVLFALP
jgi:single-stranded-DNA-specific exonuclease